ncbi:hypothetical protein DFP72DRAFT_855452 [Ephemerocybe angulata]|uniref:Uncharacterized protein n=1 Tax=Ephemerocybe angulata TaxID=980116 RepID=A0A8H6LZN1_9AGAR|nr:hypothetical protein DFP72DRAFT_855452 [Tulosesus angulatus]
MPPTKKQDRRPTASQKKLNRAPTRGKPVRKPSRKKKGVSPPPGYYEISNYDGPPTRVWTDSHAYARWVLADVEESRISDEREAKERAERHENGEYTDYEEDEDESESSESDNGIERIWPDTIEDEDIMRVLTSLFPATGGIPPCLMHTLDTAPFAPIPAAPAPPALPAFSAFPALPARPAPPTLPAPPPPAPNPTLSALPRLGTPPPLLPSISATTTQNPKVS